MGHIRGYTTKSDLAEMPRSSGQKSKFSPSRLKKFGLKLIALLRVLLVVLKISRFSLDQTRLPDGKEKHSLLRAIDRARSALPLRSVVHIRKSFFS